MIASSLITDDCIVGINVLASYRISLYFANRVAIGPTLGKVTRSAR